MTGTGENGLRRRQTEFTPDGYRAYVRARLAESPGTVRLLTGVSALYALAGEPMTPSEIADGTGLSISDVRRRLADALRVDLVGRERVRRRQIAAATLLYGYWLTDAGADFLTEMRETR